MKPRLSDIYPTTKFTFFKVQISTFDSTWKVHYNAYMVSEFF